MKAIPQNLHVDNRNLNTREDWDNEWERREIQKQRNWPFNRPTIYPELFNFVKNNDSILDIGCGDGSLLYCLKQRFLGISYYGIDISKRAIDFAIDKYNNQAKFEVIKSLDDYNPQMSFDLVVSLQTLEHLEDPNKSIKRMLSFLKQNGSLFISTVDKNFSYCRFHLWEFEVSDFENWFNNKFEKILIREVDSSLFVNDKSIIIACGSGYKNGV